MEGGGVCCLRQRAVAQRPLRQNFRIVLRPAMRDNNLTIRQVRWSLDGSGSAPGIRSWARAYGVGSLNGRRIGHELHLSRRSVTVLSQSHRSCMICGSETASTFIIMSMGAWISGGTKDFLISLTLHISRHIIRHIWMSAHTKNVLDASSTQLTLSGTGASRSMPFSPYRPNASCAPAVAGDELQRL